MADLPCSMMLTIFGKSFFFIAYLQLCTISSFVFPNLTLDVWLMNLPSTFIESAKLAVFKFFFSIYNKMFLFWLMISPYDFLKSFRFPTAIELSPFTNKNFMLLTASAISEFIDIFVCESFSILFNTYLSLSLSLGGNFSVESSSFIPTYSMRSWMISPMTSMESHLISTLPSLDLKLNSSYWLS
jgi:hypothetical protein